MFARCREELICDMAETYHIFDPFALPARQLAIYACGLREGSRVMMTLTGRKVTERDLLIAAGLDRLSWLVWAKTKDAAHNRNKPDSVYAMLSQEHKKPRAVSMQSADEFEAFRASFFKAGD